MSPSEKSPRAPTSHPGGSQTAAEPGHRWRRHSRFGGRSPATFPCTHKRSYSLQSITSASADRWVGLNALRALPRASEQTTNNSGSTWPVFKFWRANPNHQRSSRYSMLRLKPMPYTRHHSQRGITLIESLVAIVVASRHSGHPGVQMRTLTDTQTSVQWVQAIRLIEDLSERMKVHPNAMGSINSHRLAGARVLPPPRKQALRQQRMRTRRFCRLRPA